MFVSRYFIDLTECKNVISFIYLLLTIYNNNNVIFLASLLFVILECKLGWILT